MTTLAEVALTLDLLSIHPANLHRWRQSEVIGGYRDGIVTTAEIDLPLWGQTITLTQHPSGRIQLHGITPQSGSRVVELADLNRDVTTDAVCGLLCGFAGHLDYP